MGKRNRIIAFFVVIVAFSIIMATTIKPIINDIRLGLDLQGGFEVLYEVKPVHDGDEITEDTMISTAEALDRRINVLGVSEPRIDIEEGNRIRVQLAGVENQEQAREILSTTAELSFRDANDKKLLDGTDLVQGGAQQSFDELGRPIVVLELKDGEKFGEVTRHVLQQEIPVLVIWLDFIEGEDSFLEEVNKEDPKFVSAPRVQEVLNTDQVTITGLSSPEEAQTLANLLNAGALPVKLDEIYSTSVGAQFGENALVSTIFAGLLGLIAVFIFMILYYRLPGFIASLCLIVYLYLTLAIYAGLNAVLTLPGIAALILGLGMSIDANVITAERVREELRVGRPMEAAFREGNKTSFSALIDANLTGLISAVVLFIFGTSSVKGFATMLMVSTIVGFFTSVYLSRFLLGLLVKSGWLNHKYGWFGVKKDEIYSLADGIDTIDLPTKFDRFDFLKRRKTYFSISGIFIAVGLVLMFVFGFNLSIDFTSGTRIDVLSDSELSVSEVQDDLAKFDVETDDLVLSGEDNNRLTARYKGTLTQEEVNELKQYFNDKYGHDPSVSVVSPTVGKELVKNAIYALSIATGFILLYIAIRYEFRSGLAMIASILHDVFFIFAIFSIFRLEVDLNFVAAVLTIVGYSVNDTIVSFDRIRDHLKRKKRIKSMDELANVVNKSLRQVLTRSVNTAITTLFPVVFLLLIGSDAITVFSIAILIGTVVGIYSSLFIAVQLWTVWMGKELKKKGVLITYKEKKQFSPDQPQV